MKRPDENRIILNGRKFLNASNPDPEYLCETMSDLFGLQAVLILRKSARTDAESFIVLGSYPRIASGAKEIEWGGFPEVWRAFLESDYRRGSYYTEEHRQQFEPFLKGLISNSIRQAGLVKFWWGVEAGAKDCLAIIGTEEEYHPSDEKPQYYFVSYDLELLRQCLEVFSGYVEQKYSEIRRGRHKNFLQALSGDSRFTLRLTASELISDERFDNCQESMKDYVQSIYVDMATSLKVLPRRRGDEKANDLKDIGGDYPLTRLATARLRCYDEESETSEVPSELLERIWDKVAGGSEEGRYPASLFSFPDKDIFPENVSKKCRDFSIQSWVALELIRTCLFVLHHKASQVYPTWDEPSIKNLDQILFREHSGKSLVAFISEYLKAFLFLWEEDNHLHITSDWLAAWFGLMLLKTKLFDVQIQRNLYSPNERAELYKHLSCYYLYVFHWIEYGGTPPRLFSDVNKGYEQVIESTLYILCEYAHVELQLPRNTMLFKTLKQMWSSEAVLYTVHETYREHLHHAVDICFIGLFLMQSGFLENTIELDKNSRKPFMESSLQNWILAALLHDVGYGLNLSTYVLAHLDFLKKSRKLEMYLDDLERYIEKRNHSLCTEIQKWMPGHKIGVDTLDHGVISAIFALALSGYPPGQSTKSWHKDINDALRAIIRHNLPLDMINPSEEPLSFLLLFCDHLQEWDRPRMGKDFLYSLGAKLVRSPSPPMAASTIIQYLKISIHPDESSGEWRFNDGPLRFELKFKDAFQENFEPTMIWCNHFFDLQKVICNDLKRDVCISFTQPIAAEFKKTPVLNNVGELDLFRDFVREQEKGTDVCFKFLGAIQKGETLTYVRDKDSEQFTVILASGKILDKTALASTLPKDLYVNFMKWKKERIDNIRLKGKVRK